MLLCCSSLAFAVVRCSLCVVRCLSFLVCCLLVCCCSLFGIDCRCVLLFVVVVNYYVCSLIVCCSLCAVRCLLCVGCVCGLWRVACCLLHEVCYLRFVIACAVLVGGCSFCLWFWRLLPVVGCSLSVVCCLLLSVVCCMLFAVVCLLAVCCVFAVNVCVMCVVRCLLLVVRGVSAVAYWLLFAVCCFMTSLFVVVVC